MAVDRLDDRAAAYADLLAKVEPLIRQRGPAVTAQALAAHGKLTAATAEGEQFELKTNLKRDDILTAHAQEIGRFAGAMRTRFSQARQHRKNRAAHEAVADAAHQVGQSLERASETKSTASAAQALGAIVEGMAVLEGTDLAGLIPNEVVDTLKERWRDGILERGGALLARVDGEAPTGLLIEKNPMPQALEALRDRLRDKGARDASMLVSAMRQVIELVADGDRKLDAQHLDGALELANAALRQDAIAAGDATLVGTYRFLVRELLGIAIAYPEEPLPHISEEEAQRIFIQNPLHM